MVYRPVYKFRELNKYLKFIKFLDIHYNQLKKKQRKVVQTEFN